MQMTRNTCKQSHSIYSDTWTARIGPFLAHPVGVLCQNGFGKILHSYVAQFEFSL